MRRSWRPWWEKLWWEKPPPEPWLNHNTLVVWIIHVLLIFIKIQFHSPQYKLCLFIKMVWVNKQKSFILTEAFLIPVSSLPLSFFQTRHVVGQSQYMVHSLFDIVLYIQDNVINHK